MKPVVVTDNYHVNVVTVVLNGRKYLEKTIQSVAGQSYKNIGHIIIDGGSTDGTLDIIHKYEIGLQSWLSEPDKGISDAFNKGVKLCQEGYVIFLGDGDYFLDENAVERVFEGVDKEYELVCGRVQRVADSDDVKSLWISPSWPGNKFSKSSLLFRMSLPHQGLFTHTRFFSKYGLFDESCRYAMDYDLLLRAYKSFPEIKVINTIVSAWRAGGVGKDQTRNILREYDLLKRKNAVANPVVLTLIHWFSIIKYWIRTLTGTRKE